MRRGEATYAHRSLFQKLGVSPESRVAVVGTHDAAFLAELKMMLVKAAATTLRGQYDMIFLKLGTAVALGKIERAAEHLNADGALWIFHPKGKGASPTDAEVRAAGLAAGLVDNKISAYSDTHTASRYVVPLASRSQWPASKR